MDNADRMLKRNRDSIETAHVFGEFGNLAGVECNPTDGVAAVRDVGVVMLTPGMLHHVGPFRLHVHLARRLAERGYSSLRFDLSGIGESLAVGATGSSLDRAASEVKMAIDLLQTQTGLDRFVLFGLCSGADDSVHAALQDARVAGLVLLDGCGYHAGNYKAQRLWRHHLPRLTSPSKWSSLIRGFLGHDEALPSSLQLGHDIREFPNQQEAERQFLELADRDVQTKFIYTGGVSEYFNHLGQFASMFPQLSRRAEASVDYFPLLDHVAFLSEDREQLVTHVCDWISASFPNTLSSVT